MSLALSALNVYFREVKHLVNILLQVWFYLTPILYPISLVLERAQLAGPICRLERSTTSTPWRASLRPSVTASTHVRLPSAADLATLLLVSTASFLTGLFLFKWLDPRFAEEL